MLLRSQILGLLNELLNQTAHLRKGGSQAIYYCPVCNHYKRKLEICLDDSKDFGRWHCWTCSIRGNFLGSLFKRINAPASYRTKLAELTGNLRIFWKEKGEQSILALPNEFHPLYKPLNSIEYKNALSYLKRRKILPEDIIRYNIGYCEDGPYAFHIIIPSYDVDGNLNFFIGRRYYNVEGVIAHKKPEVSMDLVGFESFINYNEPLNLCEGAFDAIAIRNNAVPLFGKYPSKKLREKMIINGVKRVNMVLDEDAYEDSVKNYELLIRNVPGIQIFFVKLSEKDPSNIGFLKIHNLIRNAKEFTESDLFSYKLES